jgi:hypothetical protein
MICSLDKTSYKEDKRFIPTRIRPNMLVNSADLTIFDIPAQMEIYREVLTSFGIG